MIPPDQVNAPQTSFNEEQQLYNGVNPANAPVYRYLTRVPTDLVDPSGIQRVGPRVLTDLVATSSDTKTTTKTVSKLNDTVPRQPITGSFAAVRAVRILHQYRIGFWSDAGIIEQVASSNASDPSQAQIDDSYNKFQVFSYLPAAITPTAQEFGDLITPSKNANNVKNALSRMGINTTVVTNPVPTLVSPDAATLPDPVPFANNLSQFCALP